VTRDCGWSSKVLHTQRKKKKKKKKRSTGRRRTMHTVTHRDANTETHIHIHTQIYKRIHTLRHLHTNTCIAQLHFGRMATRLSALLLATLLGALSL
jgi:hypothetical protein